MGWLLLLIPDLKIIICGYGLLIYGVHEVSHLIVLLHLGYDIQGIAIFIRQMGVGPVPDRPIQKNHSTFVYFSGFISLIIPVLLILIVPGELMIGIIFLIIAVSLSTIDIWYWWCERKDNG